MLTVNAELLHAVPLLSTPVPRDKASSQNNLYQTSLSGYQMQMMIPLPIQEAFEPY